MKITARSALNAEGGSTKPEGGSESEMNATSELKISQALTPAEREFIKRVNRELDERCHPFARRFQPRGYRGVSLIDDIPRCIHLRDDEFGCEGQIMSTTLDWPNRKTGECGFGAISLCAYLWDVSEYEAAKVVWDFIQTTEPARQLVLAWRRGLRRMPSGDELRAVDLPWTPIPCRRFVHNVALGTARKRVLELAA